MFCLKCGNRLPEGAKFCIHCGAKIPGAGETAPEPVQPAAVPPEAGPAAPPQPAPGPAPYACNNGYTAPAAVQAPEKSYVLPVMLIIAGVLILITAVVVILLKIGVIGFDLGQKEPIEDETKKDTDTVSAETVKRFKSAEDGISVEYPSEWIKKSGGESSYIAWYVDGDPDTYQAAILIMKDDYDPGLFSYSNQQIYDVFSQTLNNLEDLNSARTELDGISCLMLEYSCTNENGVPVFITNYLFNNGNNLYSISLAANQDLLDRYKPVFEKILSSIRITGKGQPSSEPVYETPAPSAAPWPSARPAYIDVYEELIFENEQENSGTYNLIYLDGDDIPELVVENDCFVEVYSWKGGEVRFLFECGYGVGGNSGFDYLPYSGLIRNFDSDMAGAIQFVNYYYIDEYGNPSSYYSESLYVTYIWDSNGDGYLDWEDTFLENPLYFFGDSEVTEEEFESLMIFNDSNWGWLGGEVEASAILEYLENL